MANDDADYEAVVCAQVSTQLFQMLSSADDDEKKNLEFRKDCGAIA